MNPPFMRQSITKPTAPNPPSSQVINPSENEMLKYAIAAIAIGTCIGNMFVSRRVKSFLNMKNPSRTVKQQSHKSSQSTEGSSSNRYTYNSSRTSEHPGGERSWQDSFKTQKYNRESYDIPSYLQPSLKVLNLSSKTLPTKKEVKDAYRLIALEFHPDRMDDKSKSNDKIFREATDAYRELLTYIEKVSK